MAAVDISRRQVCKAIAASAFGVTALGSTGIARALADAASPAGKQSFSFKYILSSALYGKMKLDEILPETARTGADAVDIWCLPHGDQREQVEAMGIDAFANLLAKHKAKLGVLTRYPLGAFKLGDEMKVAKKLGCNMVLSGTGGPKNVAGEDAKREIKTFLERMKPHAAAAEENGVVIALENHMSSLLATPDSIRYFAEFNKSKHLGVAFAPHHLHTWPSEMPGLIEALGSQLVFFYAQEHGKGAKQAQPKEDELLQLPGYGGGLDYRPLVASLRKIDYRGWMEIFMHPFPRGVPILPTAGEITAAVNKSRAYLEDCIKQTA